MTTTVLNSSSDWRELVKQWVQNIGHYNVEERSTDTPAQLEQVLMARPQTEMSHLTLRYLQEIVANAENKPESYPCLAKWKFGHIQDAFDKAILHFNY